jgi:hypothetical protein
MRCSDDGTATRDFVSTRWKPEPFERGTGRERRVFGE